MRYDEEDDSLELVSSGLIRMKTRSIVGIHNDSPYSTATEDPDSMMVRIIMGLADHQNDYDIVSPPTSYLQYW